MQPTDIAQLLDECLQRLEAGESLEAVVASYPAQAEALRPLLLGARAAHYAGHNLPPVSGQMRSRAQFLEAAAAQTEKPRRWQLFSLPRFANALLLALMVILTGLFASTLASARSLPGQPLYGVKRSVERVQLDLTSGALNRLILSDAFDLRRAEEVRQLIAAGRTQQVAFSGFLRAEESSRWSVAEVSFTLDPDLAAAAAKMIGSYVDVEGRVHSDEGLLVSRLSVRLFQIRGVIQAQSDDEWLVDGVRMRLSALSEILGTPQVGDFVGITALRTGVNEFLALSIRGAGVVENSATLSPLPVTIQPSPQLRATDDNSGKSGDDDSGGDDNSGKGSGDDSGGDDSSGKGSNDDSGGDDNSGKGSNDDPGGDDDTGKDD